MFGESLFHRGASCHRPSSRSRFRQNGMPRPPSGGASGSICLSHAVSSISRTNRQLQAIRFAEAVQWRLHKFHGHIIKLPLLMNDIPTKRSLSLAKSRLKTASPGRTSGAGQIVHREFPRMSCRLPPPVQRAIAAAKPHFMGEGTGLLFQSPQK